MNKQEENRDSENVAFVKAERVLLAVYGMSSEYMQWMRVVKKDSTFRKVMETQKDLKDTEGFD